MPEDLICDNKFLLAQAVTWVNNYTAYMKKRN